MTRERDLEMARILHDLDELRARPSQHSAAWIKRVANESREALYATYTDLRGWERRGGPDYSGVTEVRPEFVEEGPNGR